MTSMVERVARAIYEATPRNKPWPLLSAMKRHNYMTEARAAIEAMRPPTEAMQKAGFFANQFTNRSPCGPTCIGRVTMSADKPWEAMISAALSEEAAS